MNDGTYRSTDKRAEHFGSVVDNFVTEPNHEIQRAWVDEAERRLVRYKSGYGGALSVEEVFDSIRMDSKNDLLIRLIFNGTLSFERKPVCSGARLD